jgi:iron complex transport system ATP-binding protein
LCQLNSGIRRHAQTAVLLLDEPTSSLDLSHQSLVLGEARSQADEGRAVAVVLHDLNLAAAWADEIVLMCSGRIADRGPPSEIFRDDLLSAVFGCPIQANVTPPAGTPYMLPHFLGSKPAVAVDRKAGSSSKHRSIGYAEGQRGIVRLRD